MYADLSGEAHASEADLIVRARRGEEAAWEALVLEYQQPIFRLAYLMLGDSAEAEDVTQEAFIRAFRALDRFDASRPLRPWLLQIAANLARNRRRSAGRFVQALARKVRGEPEPVHRIEERSEQQWEAQTLWQAVRRLSTADQEIIYLRYFLELSEAEAAETLDVAVGTVKSRMHRAMGRLREIIRKEFPALQAEREE